MDIDLCHTPEESWFEMASECFGPGWMPEPDSGSHIDERVKRTIYLLGVKYQAGGLEMDDAICVGFKISTRRIHLRDTRTDDRKQCCW